MMINNDVGQAETRGRAQRWHVIRHKAKQTWRLKCSHNPNMGVETILLLQFIVCIHNCEVSECKNEIDQNERVICSTILFICAIHMAFSNLLGNIVSPPMSVLLELKTMLRMSVFREGKCCCQAEGACLTQLREPHLPSSPLALEPRRRSA